jgi:hypothetical protein
MDLALVSILPNIHTSELSYMCLKPLLVTVIICLIPGWYWHKQPRISNISHRGQDLPRAVLIPILLFDRGFTNLTWTDLRGRRLANFFAAASIEAAAPSNSFSAITVGSSGSTQSVPTTNEDIFLYYSFYCCNEVRLCLCRTGPLMGPLSIPHMIHEWLWSHGRMMLRS